MIAIIGAGGHAKCVYECLYTQGLPVLGFFDDEPRLQGKEIINGVQVLGNPTMIKEEPAVNQVFVAIGDNSLRLKKFTWYGQEGYLFPNAVHPRAYVSSFATLGKGIFMMGASIINPGALVQDYCIINTNATVGHDCFLEEAVQISPGVNLAGGSRLEKGVLVGIGAKVAPGVRIGAWTVVGAGSVVLNDLPPRTFCYGVPAKVIREIDFTG